MLIRAFILILCSILSTANAETNQDNFAERPDVKIFINKMVKKHHFNQAELITIFDNVKVRPAVMRSIKAPLELKAWSSYQMLFVTEWRIRQGVDFWNKYEEALQRAEKIYGVPASIIVATIGVETKYGRNTGNYRVIDALTNISFSDSPRSAFFRSELEEFLLMTREQHLNPLKVMGSYAGAIGQPQFMPSSFRYYAVNFSGNKQIDLSHNELDVIGSIANYYKQHGWQTNQPIIIPALLKNNKYQFMSQIKNMRAFSQLDLAKYGIKINGRIFSDDQKIKLIEMQGYYGKEYWLGFHNFDVIKRYNPSNQYAMAVFQLSYYISKLREKTNDA